MSQDSRYLAPRVIQGAGLLLLGSCAAAKFALGVPTDPTLVTASLVLITAGSVVGRAQRALSAAKRELEREEEK